MIYTFSDCINGANPGHSSPASVATTFSQPNPHQPFNNPPLDPPSQSSSQCHNKKRKYISESNACKFRKTNASTSLPLDSLTLLHPRSIQPCQEPLTFTLASFSSKPRQEIPQDLYAPPSSPISMQFQEDFIPYEAEFCLDQDPVVKCENYAFENQLNEHIKLIKKQL
eukprot:TRINITY_DN3442_c0_g1_i2.p2 TRINITY_DN3442_c0_g1~~TRINITY_DN3442_c0_g1_i2.p2  ORF type:complete len:168 (-),score=52.17 TRINITY_DN3442_c0_g1_i2:503-1006(-)